MLLPTKGQLLLSTPTILGDESFDRSVVLVAEKDQGGYVGFIINKLLPYTLQDIIPTIISEIPIYNGGPVEQENLYFIHTIPHLIPNSIQIDSGIYWGGDFETVTHLLKSNKINQNQIRFFLGYSGWEASQLHQEIESNCWQITNNIHKNKLLEISKANLWKEKMKEQGGEFLLWSNAPQNPSFN